jgi:hypothetical protein
MRTLCLMAGMLVLSLAQAGGSSADTVNCGNSPRMDLADVQNRLDAAQALWHKHWRGNYSLSVQVRGAWDHFDLQLSMHGKATAKLKFVPSQSFVPKLYPGIEEKMAENAGRYYTVVAFFQQIKAMIHFSFPGRPCGIFNVMFDPVDGHPRRIEFDNAGGDDEETLLIISPLGE